MASISDLRRDIRVAAAELEVAVSGVQPYNIPEEGMAPNRQAILKAFEILQDHEILLAKMIVLHRTVISAIEGGAL